MVRPRDDELITFLQTEQRRFMAFLAGRLGGREAARDVLQAAMVKAVERGGSLRDHESATAWFFRSLRNALIDRHRREAAERRAIEAASAEEPGTVDAALEQQVCSCVAELSRAVKPEYATAVRAVDVEARASRSSPPTRG